MSSSIKLSIALLFLLGAGLGFSRRIISFLSNARSSTSSSANKARQPQQNGYQTMFPPSRRHILELFKKPNTLQCSGVSSFSTSTNICRTATGFTLDELNSFGRFPNYSVLSGVPHPTACPRLDIARACFRPFRPFRWGYHQTMCKCK
jgi:hypothetical protein